MYDELFKDLSSEELKSQVYEVQGLIIVVYEVEGKKLVNNYFCLGLGFFDGWMCRFFSEWGFCIIFGSVYLYDFQILYFLINVWYILSMVYLGVIIICYDRRSWILFML